MDYIVDLPRWTLLSFGRALSLRKGYSDRDCSRAARPVSDLFGPRFLGYVVFQFMVSILGKGK